MKTLVCLTIAAGLANAGEYAVLSNGFRIHADSHVTEDGIVRLQTSQGVIEMPADRISSFEAEEYTPPAPAPQIAEKLPEPPPNPAVKLTPQQMIARAAVLAGLPLEIVRSVAKAESAFQPQALSPKGAIGLMQLMPGTAAELNVNPYDPAENAEGGARYLRDLLLKYENDPHQVSKAIAAYNAGPGAVDKYHGIPPYRETVQYVKRVLQQYEKEQQQSKKSVPTTD
jgi:soluble lytic murein transglycosylase-like protein